MLALLALFTLPIFAEHVDVEVARTVARSFWEQNLGKQTRATFSDVTSQTEFTKFYIFNTSDGFVIVSADDIAVPVLGYSDSGNFDPQNIPVNMYEWLLGYEHDISLAISNGVSASENIATDWRKLSSGQMASQKRSRSVNALVQTRWNQGSPYNTLCPYDTDENDRTVTGCVATAMAQIMKYWNYPTQGNGSQTYTSSYGELTANFGSTTYDWNNMVNSYTNSATQAQKDAVATLMYHCGVAVQMSYGVSRTGGSGAVTVGPSNGTAEYAMENFFLYKNTLNGCYRSNYSETEWKNMLIADLDAGRPVIYTGRGDGGGHCFICDGYNNNNQFHFNWGWGGYCDGFYAINSMEPGTGGIGSGNGTYNESQSAIFGIEPNAGLFAIPNALSFSGLGGSETFMVRSSTASSQSWSATSSQSWLTVSPSTGAGSGANTTVTAIASRNNTASERTATITITQAGVSTTVSVVQPSGIANNPGCFGEDGSSTSYRVFEPGNMIIVCGEGFGYYTTGHQITKVNFTTYDGGQTGYYSDYTNNSFTIKIYEGGSTESLGGGYTSNIARAMGTQVYSQNYTQSYYGDQEVVLNAPYTINENTNFWIAIVANGKTLFMCNRTAQGSPIASENFSGSADAFDGKYLFTDTDDGTDYLNLATSANYTDDSHTYLQLYSLQFLLSFCTIDPSLLMVTPETLNFNSEGGNMNFTVKANANVSTGWTASSSASWLTLSATSGNGNGATTTVTATATENVSGADRNATITITQGSETKVITVTQPDGSLSDVNRWYGNMDGNVILQFTNGYQVIIRPENFGNYAAGNKILKVKFTTYNGMHTSSTDYVNTSFTVNIYENSSTDANLVNNGATSNINGCLGTLAYSQNYTAATLTEDDYFVDHIVELETPYTIRDGVNFWISVVANGNTIFVYKREASGDLIEGGSYNNSMAIARADMNYLSTVSSNGNDYLKSNYSAVYTDNTHDYVQTYSNEFALSYYVSDGNTPYVESSDLEVWLLDDGVAPHYDAETNISIGATDDIVIYPVVNNGGPETTTGTFSTTIKVGSETVQNSTLNISLQEGYFVWLYGTATSHSYTITADALNQMVVTGTFDVCLQVEYSGFDPNLSNNTTCITVTRATPTFTISASANPTEGGSVTGAGTYDLGEGVNLVATPAAGYRFTNWTENGTVVSTNANYQFTASADRTLVANFTQRTYNVTATVDPDNSGTISGNNSPYTYGTTVSLTAIANPGFAFVNWTDEDANVVSTNANYQFAIDGNRTFVAHFEAEQYEITATANPTEGGSVTGTGTFNYGQQVSLSATPNEGYQFVNWTENGSTIYTNANYSFTATTSRTLVANFQINTYTISASANPVAGGTVNGAGDYTHGQTVTLTATANAGYNFVNWTENGSAVSTDAEYSFTATANKTLVANFEVITYTVTANAYPVAGGTVSGANTYTHGSSCTLTASANTGYQFVNWTGSDGSVVSSNASYSFTVTSDNTYQANFTKTTVTSLPWTENFDGYSCSSWTYLNGDWATPLRWEKGACVTYYRSAATSGYYSLEMRANNSNNLVVLPQFDEPLNKLKITFQIGRGNANSGYTVQLGYVTNPSDASTFTALSTIETPNYAVPSHSQYTYDLTQDNNAPSSSSYRLAIKYTMSGEDSWYLDDFDVRVPSYTISASANPAEGGNITGAGTYNHGETCTLTAVAENGYHFVDWTENGSSVSTDAEYSFTATANRTLVANFQINSYTISASANPVAGGTVSGAGEYTHGQSVTLNATANTGYNFVNWTENDTDVSTNAEYSFNATADRTLVANFEAITYTISASAYPTEGGTITGTGDYTYGQNVTLNAVANTGYTFVNWTENGTEVSTNAEYSFSATASRTLVANFQINTYTISVSANPAEYGTVSGAGNYTHGQTVILNATANTDYSFVNWTEDGNIVSTDAEYSFTATANRILVANFATITYTIAASANPTEGGTVNGSGSYASGQTVNLNAIANTGYNFTNWTENGSVVSTNAEYSFTASADRTLIANFELVNYTISAVANPVAGGTINGAGDYTHGQTVNLSAVANTGYTFVNWTENDAEVSTDATYSFTATENRNLVANFQINTYTILASANPVAGGTVNGAGDYTYGQTVTLNATANTGYNFVNWTENDTEVSTNAEYSFTATADRTLVANFEAITYTISASASPVEGGTINGTGAYTFGQNVTLNAVANTGYTFSNWTENGTEVSTDAEYSFTANADRTLVANFQINTYTISVSANPAEYGTVNGGGNYTHGQTVTLNATANTDYTFVNWTEDGTVVSTDAEYSFTATADRTLVANFATITYTITASANPTEGGTVNGSGSYASGQTVNLNAIANEGYNFVNWTENGAVVSTDAQYSFTITADRTLVANFEAITHTISASASPAEGGTINGTGDYTYGQIVTLNAVANTGYSFVNWTENGAVVSTDAEYSFTATADRTLVANFEINTYTVTAVADPTEGGTVTIDIPSQNGVYNYGTNLVITAIANEGYHFVQWNDGVTTAQRTYMVDANAEFIAYFVQNEAAQYIIAATANPAEGGSVEGTGIYLENENVTLTATANPNYTFVNWTENDDTVSTDASYSFAVTANRTLVANFELNTYTISASANPAEGGTITGAGEYTHGQMVTLGATANAGYAFVNWTENGSVVSNTASYSFQATADRTLVANFEAVTYTITASANPEEGGTVTGTGNYAYGQTVTLTATANDGYIFANWTENGFVVSSDAEYSFTVTSDRTLVANFGATSYTISANANPTEGGTIAGTGEYVPGQTVYLIATANEGYTFVNWTENGSVIFTNPTYQFTAINDRDLVANFEINTYTIIASASPVAGGTVEGADEYTYGQTATLRATANTGYEFVNWTEDNEIVSTESEYSFIVTSNRRLVANFGIGTYTITASANPTEGGTVEGANEYTYGQTATLRATANEYYNFTNWTENDEVVSTDAEYSFTVTADRTLVANFIYNATVYTITATANPTEGGTIDGAGEYRDGETVSLSASARTNYHFVNWTENGAVVSTTAEYTFTAREDRNLVANFQKDRYTVYVTTNLIDCGTVEGDGEYEFGETATLTATPNDNYRFVNWTEAGEELSTDAEYSFEVTRDRYIVANFVYEMSVDEIELGSITVYPNPTNGMFKVGFGSINGDVTCQIVNTSGSVIETRELNVTDGSEFVFDCNVAPGVYLVRVISDDRVWTESIVINRY